MIRMAICDDEEVVGKEIYQLVKLCFEQNNVQWKYHLFHSSKALLYEVGESGVQYDLLLLDIEMPQMDGMELTLRLREFLPDALVIFITSYEKYVYDSFKVQPYRFIPKDRIREMLPEALNDAAKTIKSREGMYYVVKNQRGIEKILQKHITHIWHSGKYSYIEKVNGECSKVRATLKEIYGDLEQDMFLWIDRGCICNMSRIMKIVDDNVILTDGTKIQVSRERVADLKKELREYLMRKEGI